MNKHQTAETVTKNITNNGQPATSNQQPATSNQQPATSNQQPATNNNQMKKFSTLFALFLLCSNYPSIFGQDVTFTQWEQIPLYFNASLTGNYEGTIRFRAKYRSQWSSFQGNNGFKNGVASVEYKFKKGSKRKLSLGVHSLFGRPGQLISRKSFNLSTAVTQNLGDIKGTHHTISVGFNLGRTTGKFDADKLVGFPVSQMPEYNSKVSYLDLSAGFNWQFISTTRFRIQLGSALAHFNRPNTSFFKNSTNRLYIRYTIHGNAEVPITTKLSINPSFLYLKQGNLDQLLFGIAGKIYFKSRRSDAFQIGLHAKTTDNFYGTDINIFVLSTVLEVDSILLGFSIDRLQDWGRNAYEFSLGYILGR